MDLLAANGMFMVHDYPVKPRPFAYFDFSPVRIDSRHLIRVSAPCELPSEICTCLECRSGRRLPVEGSDI